MPFKQFYTLQNFNESAIVRLPKQGAVTWIFKLSAGHGYTELQKETSSKTVSFSHPAWQRRMGLVPQRSRHSAGLLGNLKSQSLCCTVNPTNQSRERDTL